ncbi:MAG: hypothetical protein HC904_11835 [Blastochloris sp.]|nr:hypothetical protein [Blastochloris sp.]
MLVGSAIAGLDGDITFTADEVDLVNAGVTKKIAGTGNLVFRNQFLGAGVQIGGDEGQAGSTGVLSISDADLAALAIGFASITAGRSEGGTGVLTSYLESWGSDLQLYADTGIVFNSDSDSLDVSGILSASVLAGSLSLADTLGVVAEVIDLRAASDVVVNGSLTSDRGSDGIIRLTAGLGASRIGSVVIAGVLEALGSSSDLRADAGTLGGNIILTATGTVSVDDQISVNAASGTVSNLGTSVWTANAFDISAGQNTVVETAVNLLSGRMFGTASLQLSNDGAFAITNFVGAGGDLSFEGTGVNATITITSIDSGSGDLTLNSSGSVLGVVGGFGQTLGMVRADTLNVESGFSISLLSEVARANLSTTGSGSIFLSEEDALVLDLTIFDGAAQVTAGGLFDVESAVSLTDRNENDLSFNTTTAVWLICGWVGSMRGPWGM